MSKIDVVLADRLQRKKNLSVRGLVLYYDALSDVSYLYLTGNLVAKYKHSESEPLEVVYANLKYVDALSAKRRLYTLGARFRLMHGALYLDGKVVEFKR